MTLPLSPRLAVRWASDHVSVTPDESLVRSLAILGWSVDAPQLLGASYVLGGSLAVLGLIVVVLSSVSPAGLVLLLVGGGCLTGTPAVVQWLAGVHRVRALGGAPDLCCRLVVRMRVSPTVEGAATFAARTDTGPLARSLASHVARSRGTPSTGLASFGETWGEWFPALARATALVETAAVEPPAARDRLLDRAVSTVVEGTRDRMARFASDLRGPATALYAFGVILPLALVAVLPAARAAGFVVSLPLVVALYDVVLPLALVLASAWLLGQRPVAFPAPSRPPQTTSLSRRLAVPLGMMAAVAAWVVTAWALPSWTSPLAAVAGGTGVTLVAWFRADVIHTERIRAIEAGLPDTLALVGRHVSDGHAVETALARATEEATGPIGEVLSAAVGRQRRLRVGVHEAFLGEYGALADIPSPRLRSMAAFFGIAAREGSPAGEALVTMAAHLDDLRAIERESRRELGRVTDTLQNTAVLFGPLVAGTTVALAGTMETPALGTAPVASELSVAGLGLAVGVYVLLLSTTLTVLATGLRRTLDPAVVGSRLGRTLVVSLTVYLVAFSLTGALT